MNKNKKYNYINRVLLNLAGILLGLLSLIFGAVSNQSFNIGIRVDWFFQSMGFITVMYFVIWDLKCPYCNHVIDVRGALYISNCPHCGKALKETRD